MHQTASRRASCPRARSPINNFTQASIHIAHRALCVVRRSSDQTPGNIDNFRMTTRQGNRVMGMWSRCSPRISQESPAAHLPKAVFTVYLELVPHVVDYFVWICTHPIQFVDEGQSWDRVAFHLTVDRERLRLYSRYSTKHQDCTIQDTKSAFHLMTRHKLGQAGRYTDQ